jgi:hypothetical protein
MDRDDNGRFGLKNRWANRPGNCLNRDGRRGKYGRRACCPNGRNWTQGPPSVDFAGPLRAFWMVGYHHLRREEERIITTAIDLTEREIFEMALEGPP